MIEKTVLIHKLSIAYKAWGTPDNPPLIALHGWLDNANSFDLLAPILSQHYYFLAIDLPGHGYSSKIADSCYYHFIDGIFHIIKFFDALKLKAPLLLGHSMGACLASLIAGVAPDRVAKIALIEGLGPLSKPMNTCHQQLHDFIRNQARLTRKQHPGYHSLEQAIDARSKNGYLATDLAALIVERGMIKIKDKYHWRHDKRLLTSSPLRLTEEQVLNCLEQIISPCLFIQAQQGFDYDKTVMTKRIQKVNNLTHKQLGGGHHLHMEHPELVAKEILDFLQ